MTFKLYYCEPVTQLLCVYLKKTKTLIWKYIWPPYSLQHYLQQPRYGSNIIVHQQINGEYAVHIYNGILLSHKKNEILPFSATLIDLEGIMLSKISYKFSWLWVSPIMGLYQPAIAAVSMPLTDGCLSSIIWLQQNCVLAQSCPILCNPMDCSLPGSSVHGGKNTQVGCHFLFLGIFPTQGSNSHLLHWQADPLPSAKIVNIILANHSSKEAIIPLIYYRWLSYILIAQSFSISN